MSSFTHERGEGRFTADWWADRTMPEPNTGCHIWLGSICALGYGRVWKDGKAGVLIHRIAYEQFVGPVAPELKVCHRCDCPSCVNPDHLFVGTHDDNMQDMWRKGRARPQGKTPCDRKAQILALLALNPEITAAEIASALDLSYDYIGLIARKEGISISRPRRGAA